MTINPNDQLQGSPSPSPTSPKNHKKSGSLYDMRMKQIATRHINTQSSKKQHATPRTSARNISASSTPPSWLLLLLKLFHMVVFAVSALLILAEEVGERLFIAGSGVEVDEEDEPVDDGRSLGVG